ncbi:MAG: ATP-dependent helicase [Bacteroidetes bacterium]|nr:ATP-dependent helicase [Bacteroidota bacterium]
MKLTDEQIEIINSSGDIKINAVAGSGKTTTIIEYAASRPPQSRILYLAFNRSVKNEAVKKFAERGLHNVCVETAHSLAYRNIVYSHNYKVQSPVYRSYEISEILKLRNAGERHGEFIIANHISKFISYFCNSDAEKVGELNLCDVISDAEAQAFVSKHYSYIEDQTRIFLGKMNTGAIGITHDFYLKKFQLSSPELGFDYILFDEGQDASAAMLDVFKKQKAVKVIVGDTHQQIYGWRFAVNSLEKAGFRTYNLTRSFRFGQDIADLAMKILKWKDHFKKHDAVNISGESSVKKGKVNAVLGRTNLGLLLKAVETVNERKDIRHLYFEGNINSYTYADEGASLYDVLHLYNGKHRLIRDKIVRQMKDIKELQSYTEKTGDNQFAMIVEIVKKYGNSLPGIIRKIKGMHVEDDDRKKAEVIFSTVHRCKGMEYDTVEIVNDFMTEERIIKQAEELKKDKMSYSALTEEINLLYVAVTRTRNILIIPHELIPDNFSPSENIKIFKAETKNKNENTHSGKGRIPFEKPDFGSVKKDKTYSVDKIREKHKSAYKKWTEKEDDELTKLYCEGANLNTIAGHFKRTIGSIRARILKLELEDIYG